MDTSEPSHRGWALAAGLASYLCWGLFPIYFHAVRAVPSVEVLAHRVVWSVAFLVALVATTVRRPWRELVAIARAPGLLAYTASTLLVSANWLIFIWAVANGHVLEASLGYFVNPLVNVLLGRVFLGERLTRVQAAAVGLACVGVVALAFHAGVFPWISLSLALTFGLYGFVRKRARIDAVVGLLVETALLAPVALGYLVALALAGRGAFGSSPELTVLLALAGIITAVPLIFFAMGMRALRLSTMGILQYLTPTGQFLCAVVLYGERFTAAHAVAFAFIWTSLALYTAELVRHRGAAA